MKSDRIVPSPETLARVQHLLAQYGITRIARHTNLDNLGIPVWCAYTPNSKSLVIANGKGLNDDDAQASAVMEAIERAVAGDPESEITVANIADLEAENIKVLLCLELLAKGNKAPPDDQVREWIKGRCVFSDDSILAPADALVLDRTRKTPYHMSSDGLASGNSRTEATLHALWERIERDAFVLWQLSSPQRRRSGSVDLSSITAPALQGLFDNIARAGLKLQLFEITSDIVIPTYHALLGPQDLCERNKPRYLELTAGTGTHPRAGRAIARAVTEAAQSRLTYIAGARDDVDVDLFEQPLPSDLLELFASVPIRTVDDPDLKASNLFGVTLTALRNVGITDAYVFPLSGDHRPFSVVKVVVPALENLPGAFEKPFGHRALKRILRP